MAKLPNQLQMRVTETVRNEVELSPIVRCILGAVEEHVNETLRGFIFSGTSALDVARTMILDFLRTRMDDPNFRLVYDENKFFYLVAEDDATLAVFREMMESETRDPE